MTFKTLMTAAALTLASTVSTFAACSGYSHQAMTCAEGSVYDPETNTCTVVSG
ncbi:chitin-binding domain-containing protein [Pacificoceanicola onchidii]|uniref:chitin-binding domain-containing protein n=1 Tax=Pacificoceanicola onchidii TaxID=2562685 RepID=UPI0010A56698|nr:chitin-binding domain-containing protein [Pacificoceanicola onchidii]